MSEVKNRRHFLTDEEVEEKIAQLRDDPDVRLAWKEKNVKYKRRRYLGALQSDKRRGQQLREAGITWEMLDEQEGLVSQ
mgnify:FL=1